MEVKLVEIGLHDATAAVGKLDGLDVVVADAAKLVGKKAEVTIGRVLEGQAFATLVAGRGRAAPITFESEAEKPTRAPARRKADEARPRAATRTLERRAGRRRRGRGADEERSPTSELRGRRGAEDESRGIGREDGAPKAPAKKRTRRGSRGGKRRKKPAAAVETGETDGARSRASTSRAEPETEAEPPSTETPAVEPAPSRRRTAEDPRARRWERPRRRRRTRRPRMLRPRSRPTSRTRSVHGGENATPRKRTRRGSRGGRNRKKKTRAAANGDGAVPAPQPDRARVTPNRRRRPATRLEPSRARARRGVCGVAGRRRLRPDVGVDRGLRPAGVTPPAAPISATIRRLAGAARVFLVRRPRA